MAEVIAVGASIIAIIQICDKVIGLCKFYLETVHDAPADIRAILIETSTMKTILESVQFLSSCNNGTSRMLKDLSGADGPIQGCQSTIAKMEGLFPTIYAQGPRGGRSKRQKVKATLAYLAWPLKGDRPKKLVEELNRLKATISLALTTESALDIKGIKNQTTKIHDILSDNQRRQVCEWIQATDPTSLHHRACKQYEAGTGNWMLRSSEWTDWLQGKSRCVWIYGIPGAGKTILASHLIESLKEHCKVSSAKQCAVVYYYCYFGHNQDEAASFLRWMVDRLCRQADHVPTYLYELYQHGGEPSLAELLRALEAILANFENVYIVVDAIDESMPRDDLLKVLRDLVTDSRFGKIQLLATSRQYIDIENVMELISEPVSMLNPLLDEDIKLYVRSQLDSNPTFKHWAPHLVEEVLEALATKAKGMFRWAVCQIHALQRLKPEGHVIRNALANLPKTLDETYERIFLAVPNEDRIFVREALKWIYYHNRVHNHNISCPLLLRAVQQSICESSPSGRNYLLNEELLRELCGCLITVMSEEKCYGKMLTTCTIRSASFAHYTVWEFLASNRISNPSVAFFAVVEEKTILELTKTVILGALTIESSGLFENGPFEHDSYDTSKQKEIARLINEDFNAFCVTTSILLTNSFAREISCDDDLSALVFDLLDPSRSHYSSFTTVASRAEDALGVFLDRNIYTERQFWKLAWRTPSKSVDAAILTSLLLLDPTFEFAKKFVERISVQDVLQTQLYLDEVEYVEDCKVNTYNFQGSIVDFFAIDDEPEAFDVLLDFGVGFIDPSSALLSFVGFHYAYTCHKNKGCTMAKLLQLGANPNISGYAVTPLQIAAACWDLEGVEALLKAGADPNGTNDREGIRWGKGTRLATFNHLPGVSPLRLCRQFACASQYANEYLEERDLRERDLTKIEAALLQYGAEPCSDVKMLDPKDPSRIFQIEPESGPELEPELEAAEAGGNDQTPSLSEAHSRMRISVLLS
ncbi:uncharacterized protein PAC_06633 [Phialocephala subalpina]|uniref:NACHT domain-containing protein n=1 Tax=Phialocephala subalpina TaxID=576137 RepID=A0A1L7WVD5_9HELO|nr:uncharacterized protein PAC_06633 [Phialocephala subalpina]